MNAVHKNQEKTLIYFLFFILFVGIAIFASIFSYFEFQNRYDIESEKRLKITESYNKGLHKFLKENYLLQLRVFVDDEIRAALALRDRERLEPIILRIYNRVKLRDPYFRVLHFHLPDGTSFLRAHNTNEYGDNISIERKYIKTVHENQTRVFGFEKGHYPFILYRVIEPLFWNGEYIGAVEIGASVEKILDFVTFFDGAEGIISFYDEKEPIIFHNITKKILLDTYKQNTIKNKSSLGRISIDGRIFEPYRFQINDFFGTTIGEFIFFDDFTIPHKDFNNKLKLIIVFSIFMFLLIFALVRSLVIRFQSAIRTAHHRIQTILNAQSDIVMVTNGKELIEANSQFLNVFKYKDLEAFKEKYRCICELFISGEGLVNAYMDNDLWVQYLLKNTERENIARIELEGVIYSFKLYAKRLNDVECVVTMQDVTALKDKEKMLQDYIELIDQNLLISSTDLEGDINYVSDALVRTSGYSREELIGNNHRIIKHPHTPKELHEQLWETISQDKIWHGEIKNIKKDESYFWSDVWIYPRYDLAGRKIGYTAVRHDITNKKLLEMMSITDGLTGLYNRRYFNEVMPQRINILKRSRELIGFMIIDIDFFKYYNDTYGHLKGDETLKNVASAIKSTLKRASDYAFRLGGEEFGVVFNAESKERAMDFAKTICESVEKLKIAHKKNRVSEFVTISIGLVSMDAAEVESVSRLYNQADSALYFSKKSGRNRVSFFEARMLKHF